MAGRDLRAGRRYAKALFNLALERGEVEAVADSLFVVADTATASSEVLAVLGHPLVTRERKKEFFTQVFEQGVQPDVEKFIFLLVDKGRANVLPAAAAEFIRLVDEHRGIVDATVTSALPLSEAQTASLTESLQRSTGKSIRLQTWVDESILGGLIIRVGDKLMDGSAQRQLQSIREQLKLVKVS